MAVRFHPLPVDVFPEDAKPSIARLNLELRDLFGLEAALSTSLSPTQRSDRTVARRQEPQVDFSRLSNSSGKVSAGVADVVWGVGAGPVLSVNDGTRVRRYRITLTWLASVSRPQIQLVEVT